MISVTTEAVPTNILASSAIGSGLSFARALAEAAPAAGGQSIEQVLEVARRFPRLAVAAAFPPDSSTAPLEKALRGIVSAWSGT